MESILIFLVIILIGVNICTIYLLTRKKNISTEATNQIFKDEVNSLKNSFSESFWLNE